MEDFDCDGLYQPDEDALDVSSDGRDKERIDDVEGEDGHVRTVIRSKDAAELAVPDEPSTALPGSLQEEEERIARKERLRRKRRRLLQREREAA